MAKYTDVGFHDHLTTKAVKAIEVLLAQEMRISYDFDNHFHPYVDKLVELLNQGSTAGMLDVKAHEALHESFFAATYAPVVSDNTVRVSYHDKNLDVAESGSYANYNWELFFHVPTLIAAHLSSVGRYPEAQRWFHFVFDPTTDDVSKPAPERYWRFLRFRQGVGGKQIEELLELLGKPADQCTPAEKAEKELILAGYEAVRKNPFQPHAVARTRPMAYEYWVVMRYLDNLIAWGDSLFQQDTVETINEATQLYVLAANILGPRPQRVPPRGVARPRNYRQLKAAKLDPFSNAQVTLEGTFPFNLVLPSGSGGGEASGPLFGLGTTPYFCVPHNDKLMTYWDTVADRLFKIRNCMNIAGVVRQLALFDPPLDPGMLVKAAAAGIDIGSLVAGLHQPLSPVRATLMLQKSLELAGEVRSLGGTLLSALEKKDAEALTRLRQTQDIAVQERLRDVKFLQWKDAEEPAAGLLRSRAAIFDRYRHFQLLLGGDAQALEQLRTVTLTRSELTEENFDEVYGNLVETYDKDVALAEDNPPPLFGNADPKSDTGATGAGRLRLIANEHTELNVHQPAARAKQKSATDKDELFGVLGMLPNLGVDFAFWGMGGHLEFGGPALAAVGRILAGKDRAEGDAETYQGNRVARIAGYERRVGDWIQQSNAAAHELMQNGRQLVGALLREQITRHEYETHKAQIDNAKAVDAFLADKFTGTDLYHWMQGELSRRYFDAYRMASDLARKAEQTMKRELMRPELDGQSFVRFDYWDGGRKGLLSGEALYLDVKRMELAYHEHNKREYELTKHVSLAQLDPVALLRLRATGSCEFTVPEWLYDLDTPGHYLRRIKSVGVTVPAVTGPYTSVHCTASLLRSSVRTSALLSEGEYARQSGEDGRFLDYEGTVQSVVTSGASADSGLFETNLRDERFLPFEGCGAVGTWRLELPAKYRQFDYGTISDVVLTVRYTARDGGAQLRGKAVDRVEELVTEASTSGLVRLLSLRQDFPAQWHAFTTGEADFTADLTAVHLPYFAKDETVQIDKVELYAVDGTDLLAAQAPAGLAAALTDGLADDPATAVITLPADDDVVRRDPTADVYVLLRYSFA
ncbi:hypothetical protein QEZ54_19380 [Catellatospora sp. KI3]|uniref:Tc toxin subunit A-related protein n=1 Tax=Catellatospora sp. KI3 TaxID=3041620 RepID=UPI002482832B|nr:hypothetical protein [Catellatospora sp. KI3]MDI1463145.1 hypothetical protein [Catellatospora sp. KI3]